MWAGGTELCDNGNKYIGTNTNCVCNKLFQLFGKSSFSQFAHYFSLKTFYLICKIIPKTKKYFLGYVLYPWSNTGKHKIKNVLHENVAQCKIFYIETNWA